MPEGAQDDVMRTFCVARYGICAEPMAKRYVAISNAIAQHVGELGAVFWNARVHESGPLTLNYRLGVLRESHLIFPDQMYCALPTWSYVAGYDIDKPGVLRRGEIAEGEIFFALTGPTVTWGELEGHRECMETYVKAGGQRPAERLLGLVLVGDVVVKRWFIANHRDNNNAKKVFEYMTEQLELEVGPRPALIVNSNDV